MDATIEDVVIGGGLSEIKKILVCGTGAMGSLFSVLLTARGHEVNIFGTWTEAMKTIASDGIAVYRDDEVIFRSYPIPTYKVLPAGYQADLVLVLVKTYQTGSLVKRLAGIDQNIPILTLQNGAGNKELIESLVGNPTFAGVTNNGANLRSAGEVNWVGDGGTILPDQWILRDVFTENDSLPMKLSFEIDTTEAIWEKLLINAAINPLTAIYGIKNGELLKNGGPRERMIVIIRECLSLKLEPVDEFVFDRELAKIDQVLRATAGNTSSMLSDVSRGGQTEIESITGAILREAKKQSKPTPVNQSVYADILRLNK